MPNRVRLCTIPGGVAFIHWAQGPSEGHQNSVVETKLSEEQRWWRSETGIFRFSDEKCESVVGQRQWY